MKGIIIYKSNYGSTKQYADWINEETEYPVFDLKKVKSKDIAEADTVILGCPVLANKPLMAGYISKKWDLLKNKKVVLFTTSGAKPEDPELKKGFESAFSNEIVQKIRYFPQGGKVIISKLKGMHRFMMNMGMKMEKNPEVRKQMAMDKDNVDRNGLKSLLDYIK